jgi:hypothetical protein
MFKDGYATRMLSMAKDELTVTNENSAQTTTHRIIFLQFMIEFLSSSESPAAAGPTDRKLPARLLARKRAWVKW